MVAFVALDDDTSFTAVTAGAESNLATGVAALGRASRWVSRLGDDPLGRLVVREVTDRGVDVNVEIDRSRPTGLMTKHIIGGTTDRRYYRSGSAASALGPANVGSIDGATWVHVTGITPALSASARSLVEAVADREGTGDAKVSFDVNLRPVLWTDLATAADVLLSVARRCDVVFIGDDEAEALLGTSDADELAAAILERDDQELIVKRGAGPATLRTTTTSVTELAHHVDVVDPTGAGDAFAAGYLAGHCMGWEETARLRLGHAMAARVLGVTADVVPPFTDDELARLLEYRAADIRD